MSKDKFDPALAAMTEYVRRCDEAKAQVKLEVEEMSNCTLNCMDLQTFILLRTSSDSPPKIIGVYSNEGDAMAAYEEYAKGGWRDNFSFCSYAVLALPEPETGDIT
jgi:hypothetical protein